MGNASKESRGLGSDSLLHLTIAGVYKSQFNSGNRSTSYFSYASLQRRYMYRPNNITYDMFRRDRVAERSSALACRDFLRQVVGSNPNLG